MIIENHEKGTEKNALRGVDKRKRKPKEEGK